MSVTEPSYAVKRRNGLQTGGRRLALRASLRPPVNTLAWLGWLGGSYSWTINETQGSLL